MTAKKICVCGWNKGAGKCPYPIDCKTLTATDATTTIPGNDASRTP